MALRDPNFSLTFDADEVGEFKVPSDKSLLIERVYASYSSSTEEYLQLLIDRTTVGFFMLGGNRKSHLYYRKVDDPEDSNILVSMAKKGIFKGYPVASGQSFSWKTLKGNVTYITIEGKLYDADDIKPDMENGTEANSFVYVNYGKPSADPTSSGDVLVDKSLNPAEFPDFPFGGVVPAKSRITIYGVCANAAGRASDSVTNKSRTEYIKFVKGREVLFDPLRKGLINLGLIPTTDDVSFSGKNSLFNFNSTYDNKPAYYFEKPLVFNAGEELNIYHTVTAVAGSMNLQTDDLLIALIMKYEKVE